MKMMVMIMSALAHARDFEYPTSTLLLSRLHRLASASYIFTSPILVSPLWALHGPTITRRQGITL